MALRKLILICLPPSLLSLCSSFPEMMSSSSSSSSFPSSSSRKKTRSFPPAPENKWRTGTQERIYGRRLLEALRSSRSSARAVKEAADSALAITAKGESRWSRAILSNRRRVKLQKLVKARRRRPPRPPPPPPPVMVKEGKSRVGERLEKLGSLVPGCRKLAVPSLLEETADYVAALEMQVKAMRVLADALSAATISSSVSPSSSSPPPLRQPPSDGGATEN